MAGVTNYPTALDSHVSGSPYGFAELVNLKTTTLVGDHSATTTTLNVVSTAGYPTRGVLVIGRGSVNEVVHHTGQSGGTSFTGCTRGSQGTLAIPHLNGEVVASARTASHHNDLAAAIVAIETVLGVGHDGASRVGRALARYTIGAGGAASIDFTNISQEYRNLRLEMLTFGGSGAANLLLRLGAAGSIDSGANYDYQYVGGSAAAAAIAEAFAQTSIHIGRMGVSASAAAPCIVHIPSYTATSMQKAILARYGGKDGTSSGNLVAAQIAGYWRNTAAINTIRVLPISGTLAQYSELSLYGEPN